MLIGGQRILPRVTALVAAAFLCSPAAPALAADAPVPEPVVRTIAGSGAYGGADGAAAAASFMQPTGVAFARAGVYVTDGQANTVRLIAHGSVSTVAGSRTGEKGSADGPAAAARFNRPFGVVVGADDTVYVSDSLNRKIRAIKNGVVRTIAGSGGYGSADGAGAAASFKFPRGIAIDDDGNLYVADLGVGLRTITPAGEVRTMLAMPAPAIVYGVAARGHGASLIVAYTDPQGIHLIVNGAQRNLGVGDEREPFNENNRVGTSFGVAILDDKSVVITDLWTHAVRYVTFADPPFRPTPKTRTLAGGARDGALVNGGFRDGETAAAMVKTPYAVAVAPDGRIAVADGGNRRVREIDGLSTRLPIASDLSNLAYAPRTYRIVLVGDSLLWSDVLWPESIGGILEAGLRAQPPLGPGVRAEVKIFGTSAGTLRSGSDFITNNLGDGQVDLVVFEYDQFSMVHEFDTSPELRAEAWKTVLPRRMRDLAAQLQSHGTKFALLLLPRSFDVAQVEQSGALEDAAFPTAFDYPEQYRIAQEFEDAFASGLPNTHVIRQLRPLAEADRRLNEPSLYNGRDNHLTIQGSIAVGRNLLADLLAWKPWAGAKPAN